MASIDRSRQLACAAEVLFDYVADLSHLPRLLAWVEDSTWTNRSTVRLGLSVGDQRYVRMLCVETDRADRRLLFRSVDQDEYDGRIEVDEASSDQPKQVSLVSVHLRLPDGSASMAVRQIDRAFANLEQILANGEPERESRQLSN